jgi:hypothetical protein
MKTIRWILARNTIVVPVLIYHCHKILTFKRRSFETVVAELAGVYLNARYCSVSSS